MKIEKNIQPENLSPGNQEKNTGAPKLVEPGQKDTSVATNKTFEKLPTEKAFELHRDELTTAITERIQKHLQLTERIASKAEATDDIRLTVEYIIKQGAAGYFTRSLSVDGVAADVEKKFFEEIQKDINGRHLTNGSVELQHLRATIGIFGPEDKGKDMDQRVQKLGTVTRDIVKKD